MQISLFRSLVQSRRFDDVTLRVLESILVCKDVESSLQVQSCLREFMRSEIMCIIKETAARSTEDKLYVIEFLVRTFALVGDAKSCLAMRYEGLILRGLVSSSNCSLQVSQKEWVTFAEHSMKNGFYKVAKKACENALACYETDDMADGMTDDDSYKKVQMTNNIKRLRNAAEASSSSSRSVRALAAEYLKKKESDKIKMQVRDHEKTPSVGSSLFREGIKRRNLRRLVDYQNMKQLDQSKDN
ncbi:protein DOUBLE-STRAND BREAK FORMATION [Impatiens glandulifera]|uniref:protein DOUBLE-STRAND BREAK FORMATION n=1 Tax=Impatiens glandulifera TaxID=253017 RepID=UPI001FB07F5F|nr:protein DOUBLE-STRAND BREAK FORMATION [Impatiens glandulifera]